MLLRGRDPVCIAIRPAYLMMTSVLRRASQRQRGTAKRKEFGVHPTVLSPSARAQNAQSQTAPRQAPRVFLALALGLSLALGSALDVRAQAAPDSFADLAQQISPSVVNITTSAMVAAPTGNGPMVPEGSPFEDFFRDFMTARWRRRPAGAPPVRGAGVGLCDLGRWLHRHQQPRHRRRG